MPPQLEALIYAASIWVIPLIIAITFHEAAHGYVARFFGDNTAWQFGRVTLNPFKHIDPIGTILLPALLFMTRSPFLFGYAKPVPVDFRALRNPRRDMAWVAAAGPAMNIALAVLAALLFHLANYLPSTAGRWVAENLKNALVQPHAQHVMCAAGSTEFPVYGRLLVTNNHASSVESVAAIMASNNTDDTTTVSFSIAPMTTLLLPLVVLRVLSPGTGANINMALIA
jgi:hypothetical protein